MALAGLLLLVACGNPLKEAEAADDLAVEAVPHSEYLEFASGVAELYRENLDSCEGAWFEGIRPDSTAGYRPPSQPVYLAALLTGIYELGGDPSLLEDARKLMLGYSRYREAYPGNFAATRSEFADGLPVVPGMFTLAKFARVFETLLKAGELDERQKSRLEEELAHSADFMIREQEWGPMNRAMLRAEALLYVARLMPAHPHADRWRTYGEALLHDNLGKWNIEDATLYHAIWLYAVMGYCQDVSPQPGLFDNMVMSYYAGYNLELLSPLGQLPDYGDATWRSRWYLYMAFFELSAEQFEQPQLRFAARKLWDANRELSGKNLHAAMVCTDILRWTTGRLSARIPVSESREVLEDQVGKKVVFRSGWEDDDAYCLLNYRDEGSPDLRYRSYLRQTLRVETEKMHHGHADENSIVLLVNKGAVLLHDAGYREELPSGPNGAYRADIFHNRLVLREGVPEEAYDFDSLRDEGNYKSGSTQKIDFVDQPEFSLSHTRLSGQLKSADSDRILIWLKEPNVYLVLDVLMNPAEKELLASALWHTRQVSEHGENWFDTYYDSLRSVSLPLNQHLLMVFPEESNLSLDTLRRYYQEERVISSYSMGNQPKVVLPAVLIPHDPEVDPLALSEKVDFGILPEAGIAMFTIGADQGEIQFGVKLNPDADSIRHWRRPSYSWESGKREYGQVVTDANYFLLRKSAENNSFVMVGGTRFDFEGRTLFQQPERDFRYRLDKGDDLPGRASVRLMRAEFSGQGGSSLFPDQQEDSLR